MRRLLVSFSALALILSSGCASYFKRKQCEQVNWYEHGYQLAMTGQRADRDQLVMECRKVEADIKESQLDRGFKEGMSNYCKPDIVLQTGKKGENLNLDLCDAGQAKILKAKHAEGVRLFCDSTNGYPFGASGKKYNGICPENMEAAFKKEYQRGRKKFLEIRIDESQAKIRDLDGKMLDTERRKSTSAIRLATLPAPRLVVVEGLQKTIDDYAAERSRLQEDLRRAETEIAGIRQNQESLKSQMYDDKREMVTLD
jgi:hypothetical protein